MGVNEILQLLGTIGALIMAGIAWYKARDTRKLTDADAARGYAEAAEKVSEENAKLRKRLEGLEQSISRYNARIAGLEQMVHELQEENKRLKEENASLLQKLQLLNDFKEFIENKKAP